MALLNAEFLLLLDQQLEGLEIRKLRAQLLFHERLTDVEARLDERNHRLKLMDGGRDSGLLSFFLILPEKKSKLVHQGGTSGQVVTHARPEPSAPMRNSVSHP